MLYNVNLEYIYGEINQLCSLFTNWDWERYFHEVGHNDAAYDLVNPGIGMGLRYIQYAL